MHMLICWLLLTEVPVARIATLSFRLEQLHPAAAGAYGDGDAPGAAPALVHHVAAAGAAGPAEEASPSDAAAAAAAALEAVPAAADAAAQVLSCQLPAMINPAWLTRGFYAEFMLSGLGASLQPRSPRAPGWCSKPCAT